MRSSREGLSGFRHLREKVNQPETVFVGQPPFYTLWVLSGSSIQTEIMSFLSPWASIEAHGNSSTSLKTAGFDRER